jgi:hypothetical protein
VQYLEEWQDPAYVFMVAPPSSVYTTYFSRRPGRHVHYRKICTTQRDHNDETSSHVPFTARP